MTTAMNGIAATCVYTIVHTDALDAAYKAGGIATFHEGRRWATASRMLVDAREAGLRVPVVFAAAEYTADLIYFGWLEDIVLGAADADHATTFRVSGLAPFPKPPPKKTSLFVAETGRPIPASHIRPYVLCRTPAFLGSFPPPAVEKVLPRAPMLFSWGYWGWGNATTELIQAVDAAEASRGFEQPIFVDCRIRRNVRAKGFTGDAFERVIGAERYRWFQDLGNESVLTGGGPIRIRNTRAAAQLLDLGLEAAGRRQRLLFFCACEFPISCHRFDIADLVIGEAEKRGIAVTIQEWPGGEPTEVSLLLDEPERKRVLAGAPSARIDGLLDLGFAASIAWGTKLTLRGSDPEPMLTGPVKRSGGRWVLPVIRTVEPGAAFQKRVGYTARASRQGQPRHV
jgi:hypothetical protein